jgi:hypothetical protein
MSSEEPSPGDKARKALTEIATCQRPRPSPEFAAFLESLDAMGVHIATYLICELKLNSSVLPKLLPLIDRRCFEERLEFEIDDMLKKFEEDT